MGSSVIIFYHPLIEVFLQLLNARINLLAESYIIELLLNGFMESFTDAVGLWFHRLGLRMIDILYS